MQTSTPQMRSEQHLGVKVFVVTQDLLVGHIKPTTDPVYKKTETTEIFEKNKIEPPPVRGNQETSHWVPIDGLIYVPLFCHNCRPYPWCLGVKIKGNAFLLLKLISRWRQCQ
jgi:hypothetical protein